MKSYSNNHSHLTPCIDNRDEADIVYQRVIKKLGIKYDPPTLSIEYSMKSNIANDSTTTLDTKRHKKIKVPIHTFLHNDDIKSENIQNDNSNDIISSRMDDPVSSIIMTKKLIERYPQYIGKDKVNYEQIIRLVSKLYNHHSRTSLEASNTTTTFNREDLDGHITGSSNSNIIMNNDESRKISKEEPHGTCTQLPNHHDTKELIDITILGDLNKVSEEELIEAKNVMNVLFESSCVRPGEKEYEYDKRVDFGEAESCCSWD